MTWCGTETPQFDENLVDAESIDKVEKETAKLLANIKGDRPWMTALKQRSKEIKAAKASKPLQPVFSDGHAAPLPAENKTLPDAAENTMSDQALLPQKTEVPRSDAAASSAEPLSLVSTSEALPQPSATKAQAVDPKYVPTCDVGDIVRVKAFREQYNGFKAQVLTVLTGDVRVDFLEGPTVGTKDGNNIKFKFNQVKKLSKKEPKAEPEKKEEKKEKKSKLLQTMHDYLKKTTDEVP